MIYPAKSDDGSVWYDASWQPDLDAAPNEPSAHDVPYTLFNVAGAALESAFRDWRDDEPARYWLDRLHASIFRANRQWFAMSTREVRGLRMYYDDPGTPYRIARILSVTVQCAAQRLGAEAEGSERHAAFARAVPWHNPERAETHDAAEPVRRMNVAELKAYAANCREMPIKWPCAGVLLGTYVDDDEKSAMLRMDELRCIVNAPARFLRCGPAAGKLAPLLPSYIWQEAFEALPTHAEAAGQKALPAPGGTDDDLAMTMFPVTRRYVDWLTIEFRDPAEDIKAVCDAAIEAGTPFYACRAAALPRTYRRRMYPLILGRSEREA